MPDDQIVDALSQNATGPKSITTPDGSVVQHEPTAQIAADKYRRACLAASNPFAAVHRRRIVFGRADGNPGTLCSNPDYPNDVVPR